MLYIISGKFKGRKIPTIKDADYRPSTGRFRESLFSILGSGKFLKQNIIENAKILDIFAGTGSLSFEAMSRGAKSAALVDINKEYLNESRKFANKLEITESMEFLNYSAYELPHTTNKYNLVFIDPPYDTGFPTDVLNNLVKKQWLDKNAIIILEIWKKIDSEELDNLEIIDQRTLGKTKMVIMEYNEKI